MADKHTPRSTPTGFFDIKPMSRPSPTTRPVVVHQKPQPDPMVTKKASVEPEAEALEDKMPIEAVIEQIEVDDQQPVEEIQQEATTHRKKKYKASKTENFITIVLSLLILAVLAGIFYLLYKFKTGQ